MSSVTELDVLSLVTTDNSRFYRQQQDTLTSRGVSSRTISVPGNRTTGEARSSRDYLRFYPTVLRHSLDSYDLVHANFGLTAPHALAQPRRPVVLSLWGTDVFGRYGRISRACAGLADAVIVMSEEMAAALDCECHVIPHGVDIERFAPEPQTAARRELGWSTDVKQVLFPYGKDRPVKNYPLAKRVVDEASERLDEPVRIQTVTGVPHDEMSTYMNAADVLLLTSKWEGSPNSVKEAMACNLPVVSRPVGDVSDRLAGVEPSVVADSESELVEGLVSVLASGEQSNGREAARELSLERMGDQIVDVYTDVLERTA